MLLVLPGSIGEGSINSKEALLFAKSLFADQPYLTKNKELNLTKLLYSVF